MRRFTLVMLAGVNLLVLPAWSQSSPAQLCVANMQANGLNSPNTFGRDALVKFLGKEKDKSVAQAVPIDAYEPEQALQEAKAKNCAYVVTTNQTESHSDSSNWGTASSVNPINNPIFYVTTAFKLTKVSDGADVLSGSTKASDRGSEQNAIGFTMHKIADKCTEAIKKAGH